MQELVNAERIKKSLPPLILDDELCRLAGLKAMDMCSRGYFGHHSDRLGSMTELVTSKKGNCDRVGENIALNFLDEETVHAAWMSSALHRKNILDRHYRRFGFASAQVPDAGWIYVQVFTGETQIN
ncbi:MAG: CAP domain-containing protein [Bacillota bacterium]|nr:CAP domain-containing protein [Bacillota bacterium]MDW7682602.1 CAP domain-containing protein [Bacillota bacterium]